MLLTVGAWRCCSRIWKIPNNCILKNVPATMYLKTNTFSIFFFLTNNFVWMVLQMYATIFWRRKLKMIIKHKCVELMALWRTLFGCGIHPKLHAKLYTEMRMRCSPFLIKCFYMSVFIIMYNWILRLIWILSKELIYRIEFHFDPVIDSFINIDQLLCTNDIEGIIYMRRHDSFTPIQTIF